MKQVGLAEAVGRICDEPVTTRPARLKVCLAPFVLTILAMGWAASISKAAFGATPSPHKPSGLRIDHVWVNTGGDKVTREELRAAKGRTVTNSVWNGKVIHLVPSSARHSRRNIEGWKTAIWYMPVRRITASLSPISFTRRAPML